LLWVLVGDILPLLEHPEECRNIWSTYVTFTFGIRPDMPRRVVLGMTTNSEPLVESPEELAPKGRSNLSVNQNPAILREEKSGFVVDSAFADKDGQVSLASEVLLRDFGGQLVMTEFGSGRGEFPIVESHKSTM
jgi:hypothetical protein